jgi:hypothetical protein
MSTFVIIKETPSGFSVSRVQNSNVDNFLPEFDIANSWPFEILTTLLFVCGFIVNSIKVMKNV